MEKVAHAKEEKPKKSIQVGGKYSSKQQKEDKDKSQKDVKKKENRFNIYDNSAENKNLLVMLPVEKDSEGNYDASKVSVTNLNQTNEKQKTFEELDKKLFFNPSYLPQKVDKLYDKEPSQTLSKLTERFNIGFNSNSLNNLVYNKDANWFAFTVNNKVMIRLTGYL